MRKTKIICTLGPKSTDEKIMKELLLEGMNVARFNFHMAITKNIWANTEHF